MDVPYSQVFFPASFAELFSLWGRYPGAAPFAGGVSLMRGGGAPGGIPKLPGGVLSLERIEELQRVTRTERYLEIGAMVKLNDIIALGKIVPEALVKTLESVAGLQVRNLATLGGGICGGLDIAAPMIALDARYELRSASQNRWISALRFSSFDGPSLAPHELLTKVRVPLEQWNYCLYRKFYSRDLGGEPGGALVFVAKNEKNILTELRIVFAGRFLLRDKNSEVFLEGRQLPLDRKDALHYGELWRDYLSGMAGPGPLLKARLVNTIVAGIRGLAD